MKSKIINKYKDYVITVNMLGEAVFEDDYIDKDLFEKSVIDYIKVFGNLPNQGTYINNGRCDFGLVESCLFDPVNKEITIDLSF